VTSFTGRLSHEAVVPSVVKNLPFCPDCPGKLLGTFAQLTVVPSVPTQ
jgi:hypothetical protein